MTGGLSWPPWPVPSVSPGAIACVEVLKRIVKRTYAARACFEFINTCMITYVEVTVYIIPTSVVQQVASGVGTDLLLWEAQLQG